MNSGIFLTHTVAKTTNLKKTVTVLTCIQSLFHLRFQRLSLLNKWTTINLKRRYLILQINCDKSLNPKNQNQKHIFMTGNNFRNAAFSLNKSLKIRLNLIVLTHQ